MVAKKKNKTASSARSTSVPEIQRLSFPGIKINDVLELEEIFPDLKENLIKVGFAIALLAQISSAIPNLKGSSKQEMVSMNTYVKKLLAKSKHCVKVAAAIAIRKTMAAYAKAETEEPILVDYNDLWSNLTGKASLKGGLTLALTSPEKLRIYRRGLMMQAIGTWHSQPIYTPLQVSRDIAEINKENFHQVLPFKTSEDQVFELLGELKGILDSPDFHELYSPETGTTPLEDFLEVKRTVVDLPPPTELSESEIQKLPLWKRASIKQTEQIQKNRKDA